MVHKMLLDRQDLYNVRLSLDLDINSARHTHQLGHVITEEKEAIYQEVYRNNGAHLWGEYSSTLFTFN